MSLYTAAGQSSAAVIRLQKCGALASPLPSTGVLYDSVSIHLATLKFDRVHHCVSLTCGPSHCFARTAADPLAIGQLAAGKALSIKAFVRTYNGTFLLEACPEQAMVMISGSGCAADTLTYFLVALTCVVAFTVLFGLILETWARAKVTVAVECSLDVQLPNVATGVLPTVGMLRATILDGLSLPPEELPPENVSAWLVPFGGALGGVLHVEYALRSLRNEHQNLRRRLLQTAWRPASLLAAWDGAKVEQQPPALVKERGKVPGLELPLLLERFVVWLLGGQVDDDASVDLRALQLEIARKVLEGLDSGPARVFLTLQYLGGFAAAGCLPYVAYVMMSSCKEGYPQQVHMLWLIYILTSGFLSIMLLVFILGRSLGATYIFRFRGQLLLRLILTCLLLTDTYQDATFPVIAKKCGFDLWFVSLWLVSLGVGLMEVCVHLFTFMRAAVKYHWARTPEERRRIFVRSAFLALRGSDNFILVYAVRPAVEEQLGGTSSWAMKTSEARVAFFRFIFEDVEHSALQVVFLFLYNDSVPTADKAGLVARLPPHCFYLSHLSCSASRRCGIGCGIVSLHVSRAAATSRQLVFFGCLHASSHTD